MYTWKHKISYCGGFIVFIISPELVVLRDNFLYLQYEKRKMVGHHSADVEIFRVEVRHFHRMFRNDLVKGILKICGFIIMVGEDTYFSIFGSRLVKFEECEVMEGHGSLVPASY